jgi:hypothetical protein
MQREGADEKGPWAGAAKASLRRGKDDVNGQNLETLTTPLMITCPLAERLRRGGPMTQAQKRLDGFLSRE